jgi:flagellar hook-associated protein 1 FlgK
MSILNIGTQALQANQVALQTAGNNIANVNTPGYSRQTVVFQTVEGQFTGGGYIGKGVNVATIQRNFSDFLTRQSTLASSTQSADTVRADNIKQLEGLFTGGPSGLGASISDMLNAFSDVASSPTDLTARTVALTKVDETAARLRSTSQQLDDLQTGVSQALSQKVTSINSLAQSIADVNTQIARANGSGQPPNDLLDRRDQLVRDLNQYVQTTSIPASDGTVGIFIGGSQALVLGSTVSPVSLVKDFSGTTNNKLAINRNGQQLLLDENTLGGGSVPGLLRFQNTELVEGRNLLGRLTMSISTEMNTQHALGLDLNGNVGGNLFSPTTFGTQNVLTPTAPATLNAGTMPSLTLTINDPTKFVASDYAVSFSNANQGSITRKSDGVITPFDFTVTNPVIIDGINIAKTPGVPAAGDQFLLKPFATSATNIQSQFSTPSALAVASPVVGQMGTTNTGSLQQTSLLARSNPPTPAPGPASPPVTLTFAANNTYTRSDFPGIYTYTPGVPIEGTVPATNPLSQWSMTLQGSPKPGDTVTVSNTKVLDAAGTINLKLNAGNANAMMGLRDMQLFDGAALTDGYAGLIAQIGVRSQSANYAATTSTSIASNLEQARTGVSGVNLDEEAAKLLQFQQAYQASAKMIQISQNIFDTLIQGLGR